MPPRRRATPPPIDVDDLRSRLDQGKIVRVAIAHSAQFPQGSVGRVRRIGDPGIDGEEFIHVELTVNGMKDLLPFAPGDLTAPTKGTGVRGPAPVKANGIAPAATVRATTNGTSSPGHGAAEHGTTSALRSMTTTAAPLAARAGSPDPVRANDSGLVGVPFGAAPGPAAPPPTPRPARPKAAAKRRGPTVAISIGTTEADPPQWRIEARVGSKVVLRHGSVPPARVWELVGALGEEALSRAVGTVLDEQRQAAQARADALAAELAKVQAELAELPRPGSTTERTG